MIRFLLILLLSASQALAATYYVDFDTGSDSNNGTSTATPWKYSPDDGLATSTSAATSLAAGDTVVFKGGVTYVSRLGIKPKANGTPGNFITYDGSGATWGTGRAILTSTNADILFFALTNRQWLKWDGMMLTNIGGYREDDPIWGTTNPVTSPPDGWGFWLDGITNAIFTNLVLAEIGQWQTTIPMDDTGSMTGNGIGINGGSNVVVTGCEFTKMHRGIMVKASPRADNIMITNNSMHNYVNWSIDVNPASGGVFDGVRIVRNRIYNCAETDNSNWTGYGDSPHRNSIFLRTSAISSSWTNVQIFHNYFHDDDTNTTGGTSIIYLSQGASAEIAFNVFAGRASAGLINVDKNKAGVSYQYVRVWNNTFASGTRLLSAGYDSVNTDEFVWVNNVIYRDTATRNNNHATITATNALSNFNQFWARYTPQTNHYVFNYLGAYATLDNWRTWSLGQDADSFIADPQFTSLAGVPTSWDLRPMAGSPALTGGTNMTAFGVTADLDGVALPSSGDWPIGAYSGTNAPTAFARAFSTQIGGRGVTFGGRVELR